MFFGVIYNAAASIGTTISGVVTGFASNIMTAFRPQITKSYAQDNIPEFQSLLSWAIKSILLIYSLIAIPVGFAIDEILSLWLVEVPVYADVFCQLLLISIFFETTRFIIIMGIHATGVVKLVSIFSGITFCINPFIIYLLYSLNLPPAYAYVSVTFVNIVLSIINIFILKHNEPRVSLRKLVTAILQVIFVAVITIGIVYFVCQYKTEKPFIDIIIIGATSSILMCLLGFFVALNKEQRQRALGIIRSKIKR